MDNAFFSGWDQVATTAGATAALRQQFPTAGRYLDFRPYVVASGSQVDVRRSPLTAQLTEDDVLSRLRLRGVFDGRRRRCRPPR